MNRCKCTNSSPDACSYCVDRERDIERRVIEIADAQDIRLRDATEEEIAAISRVAEIAHDQWVERVEAV